MDTLQHILVYITVAMAVGYMLKKFVLPKSLLSSKKRNTKACGQEDCGCH
ncbi:hypothetical protein [Maribacter sp. 2304DJ31-5]